MERWKGGKGKWEEGLTFDIPVFPIVAEAAAEVEAEEVPFDPVLPDLALPIPEPDVRWSSFLRLTPGVARCVVPMRDWHLAHTIFLMVWRGWRG